MCEEIEIFLISFPSLSIVDPHLNHNDAPFSFFKHQGKNEEKMEYVKVMPLFCDERGRKKNASNVCF